MNEAKKAYLRQLPILNRANYLIAVDIEHCGSNLIENQPTSIGCAHVDVNQGFIMDSHLIGHIHLEDGRTWDSSTEAWWMDEPSMKDIKLNTLDCKKNTIELSKAMKEFVDLTRKWTHANNTNKKYRFLSDTVSGDTPHLMACLDYFETGACLPKMLSSDQKVWRDVVFLDEIKYFALALVDDPKTLLENVPRNLKPHDAQSDAIHIADQYLYYRKAALASLL